MEILREDGSEKAISMLLQRFKSTITSGITDREEKEYILELIVNFGEKSLQPLREFLRTEEEVRFPLLALTQLTSSEARVAMVLEILREIGSPSMRDHSRVLHFLEFLQDHQDPQIAQTVFPLLEDMDDDIRVATVLVLGKQEEQEEVRQKLLENLLEENESFRLRNAILDVFAQTGWRVKGFRKSVEEVLPEGYKLDRKGVVKKA